MKKIAVIPARGGSKGIPNKNLILLKGRPLIYYAIDAALSAKFDEVWVNTDSHKIANIAEKNQAKVFMRPDELATDQASSDAVLFHFCQHVEGDLVALIQPTSPLLKGLDLVGGLKLLEEYDSVFSGYYEHWVPRWQKISGKMTEYAWSKDFRPRRQEVPKMMVENGAFYLSKRNLILENQSRYSGKIGFFEMPYSRSFQLDSYDDLLILESLMK